MTTPTTIKTDAPNTPSWGETAVRLAGHIAAEGFNRGDLASLRRMNPDEPNAAAFWRLASMHNLSGNPQLERKWALIMQGIALMTKTAGSNPADRSAHLRNMPIGRALFIGDNPERTTPFYSESRLNRLLTARGPMLRTLLKRMFRMTASANLGFDWYQMALLILNEGYNEERANEIRINIARDYYRAENQANRQAN